jgi:hypothetical protein
VVVSGSIKALTKSFIIPHPIFPETKKLEHGSLEGPEHGAYQRGTGKGLEKVDIKLPDYWSHLVEKDYTILLTPKCNHNLYVASQNPDSFTVRRIGRRRGKGQLALDLRPPLSLAELEYEINAEGRVALF